MGDTKGLDKELAISFYFRELGKRIKKAKFVFVTSYHALKGTGEQLITNLKTFAQAYKNVEFLEGKISMCVTQVDADLKNEPEM